MGYGDMACIAHFGLPQHRAASIYKATLFHFLIAFAKAKVAPSILLIFFKREKKKDNEAYHTNLRKTLIMQSDQE